jgi:O-antigen ligase
MIRMTILALFLLFIWTYAFKDWFISLCGLILFTVMTQNDDMPTYLLGIQGLNPWNVSIVVVTIAWAIDRMSIRAPWNVPKAAVWIVLGYVGVLVVGCLRAVFDGGSFPQSYGSVSAIGLLTDLLINPLKYFWAAVLLGDGCRDRQRIRIAVATIIGLGVLYALFMLKNIPLSNLGGGSNFMAVRHKIDKLIGLHANDMAKVLVLTFWGIFVSHSLWRGFYYKIVAVGGAIIVMLAVGLCFSRGGYLTFIGVGFVLACVRWRRLLLLGPVVMTLILLLMPSIANRMLMGFGEEGAGDVTDWNTVTAGRTGNLWPPVVEEIGKAPIIGYGRLAMIRTSVYQKIMETEGTVPTSPHNGFLEVMIESGLVGTVIVMAFYVGIGVVSLTLLGYKSSPILVAVGGLALAHAVGCLINAMSGAMLYPDQGMLGTMCAFAVALRVWCARDRLATPVRAPAARAVVRAVPGRILRYGARY